MAGVGQVTTSAEGPLSFLTGHKRTYWSRPQKRRMSAVDVYLVVPRKQTLGSGGMMSGFDPLTAVPLVPAGMTTPLPICDMVPDSTLRGEGRGHPGMAK